MRFLQGEHGGTSALVEVGIVDAARYAEFRGSGRPLLQGIRRYRALIDTGATVTMVTTKVVDELGLIAIGRKRYQGLQGISYQSSYLFHVGFYDDQLRNDDDVSEPDPVISRTFVGVKVINGAEISSSPSFDVLLGMDVITTGELYLSRDGTFRFAF